MCSLFTLSSRSTDGTVNTTLDNNLSESFNMIHLCGFVSTSRPRIKRTINIYISKMLVICTPRFMYKSTYIKLTWAGNCFNNLTIRRASDKESLTWSNITYSNVILLPLFPIWWAYDLHASNTISKGKVLFKGTNTSLSVLLVACNEIAKETPNSVAIFGINGTTPEVEIVIFGLDQFNPCTSVKILTALLTCFQL